MSDVGVQQEIFQLFDSKGDGKIEASQVGPVLRAMGQNPTEAEVNKCIETFDPKERVTFEVFLPILQSVARNKGRYSVEDMVEGLRNFDSDGNGFISSAELRHLLTGLGEKMSDDEVDQLMDGGGNLVDENGQVNYENFVKHIMQC